MPGRVHVANPRIHVVPRSAIPCSIAAAIALVVAALSVTPALAGWDPIPPEELAQRAPTIDAGADAEVLLREVQVVDEYHEQYVSHREYHVRLKVFTEHGRETQGTVRIPHGKRVDVEDVEGRTVLPDGTEIPVDRSAIFDRDVYRSGGEKEKEVSFAFSGVQTGAILEYRYTEIHHGVPSHYARFDFQSELATRRSILMIKPVQFPEFTMHLYVFGPGTGGFSGLPGGSYRAEGIGLHGSVEEPYMPDESRTRTWALVYYEPTGSDDASRYWRNMSRTIFDDSQSLTRPGPELRDAAQSAIGDAQGADEKLARLYGWCRTHVHLADDEKREPHPPDGATATEILAAGAGDGRQVDFAFLALARAVGFDARIALLSSRRLPDFNPSFLSPYLLRALAVAVRMPDSTWGFYCPNRRFLAAGRLDSECEGVRVLVTDRDEDRWTTTPLSKPGDSHTVRRGTFRLDEQGTVEGDVRVEATGHAARALRVDLVDRSAAEREKSVRDQILKRLPDAEVSALAFDGLDSDGAAVVRYHLRVPGYASPADRQVALQPEIFRRGIPARFTATDRRQPLEFPYGWSEVDSIRIDLPPGMHVQSLAEPEPVLARGVSRYDLSFHVEDDGRALDLERLEVFGENGSVDFPVSSYAGVRGFFDAVAQRDQSAVLLARADATKSADAAKSADTGK